MTDRRCIHSFIHSFTRPLNPHIHSFMMHDSCTTESLEAPPPARATPTALGRAVTYSATGARRATDGAASELADVRVLRGQCTPKSEPLATHARLPNLIIENRNRRLGRLPGGFATLLVHAAPSETPSPPSLSSPPPAHASATAMDARRCCQCCVPRRRGPDARDAGRGRQVHFSSRTGMMHAQEGSSQAQSGAFARANLVRGQETPAASTRRCGKWPWARGPWRMALILILAAVTVARRGRTDVTDHGARGGSDDRGGDRVNCRRRREALLRCCLRFAGRHGAQAAAVHEHAHE